MLSIISNNAATPALLLESAASPTADYMQIRSNGATSGDILTVDSSGRVGIGTTSPGAKLDVNGNIILASGTDVNEFSTDGTLAGNSDDAVPTEKATKTYADGGLAKVKVGTFTRGLGEASGTQSITGVGFKPKAITFFMGYSTGGTEGSRGFDDGTTHNCLWIRGTESYYYPSDSYSIYWWESDTAMQQAYVSSMDADGFTLTWTKTGSPAGSSMVIKYLAIR